MSLQVNTPLVINGVSPNSKGQYWVNYNNRCHIATMADEEGIIFNLKNSSKEEYQALREELIFFNIPKNNEYTN